MTKVYRHRAVLLQAVCNYAPIETNLLVDATVGGGGHAKALLKSFPQAKLWGCDRDAAAITATAKALQGFGERVYLKQLQFSQLSRYLAVGSVDYLLADLGVSSAQLEAAERGFSFHREGPLDMRMDPRSGYTAATFLAKSSPKEIQRVFSQLGEERFAGRLARAVSKVSKRIPLTTTVQLARLAEEVVPKRAYRPGRHPATRIFQALRIHVNQELEELTRLLQQAPILLSPKGRLAVISFHSLEDRLVKQAMRGWAHPCDCPPDLPLCICKKQPFGEILTPKAIKADPIELKHNPRARSAKLRVFQRSVSP